MMPMQTGRSGEGMFVANLGWSFTMGNTFSSGFRGQILWSTGWDGACYASKYRAPFYSSLAWSERVGSSRRT
jgi:hypothetical protein